MHSIGFALFLFVQQTYVVELTTTHASYSRAVSDEIPDASHTHRSSLSCNCAKFEFDAACNCAVVSDKSMIFITHCHRYARVVSDVLLNGVTPNILFLELFIWFLAAPVLAFLESFLTSTRIDQ